MSYLPTVEELEAMARKPERVTENAVTKDRVVVLESTWDGNGVYLSVRLEVGAADSVEFRATTLGGVCSNDRRRDGSGRVVARVLRQK